MTAPTWTPNAYRWRIAEPWDGAADLAHRLRTGRLVAQLLYNRGIRSHDAGRDYLQPKLGDLNDPELLPGTVEAAGLIMRAIRNGEKIVLYGDYDVDGMAGVAILYRAMRMLKADVDYYIPHRIDEGYGLNLSAVEAIASGGAKLLITVDCGICSTECVQRAAELGVAVVITDHHTAGESIPAADVIVHPTVGGACPNADLCGAGVALKLAWQLCRAATGARRVSEELKTFLMDATSMAALGTIADVVPLTGENRVLVTFGLKGLPSTRHPGLRALMTAAGLIGQRVGAYDVGFLLAPRLNAAGRMEHARHAAELLIRGEEIDCAATAKLLTDLNTERQRIEREICDEAFEMAAAQDGDARVLVLAKQGWHAGVVGIVASRLVRRFHKPAVVIALDGESGSGSGRSIAGYHLAEAFSQVSGLLTTHGGHAMAAGLKIRADQVEAFTRALQERAIELISLEMLKPTLEVDAEIDLADLSLPLVQQIESMAPFGAANPPPLLALTGAVLHSAPSRMGQRGKTLGLLLSAGRSRLRCVGFGMGDAVDHLVGVRKVDVVGQPAINTFNGRSTAELHIKDLRRN